MKLNNLSQLLYSQEGRRLISVTLNQTANVLDCLSLSEHLKAHSGVEDVTIYLSPDFPCTVGQTDHSSPAWHTLKVLLKGEVSKEEGLALSEALKANTLVKEFQLYCDSAFTQAELLRIYLKVQSRQREADALLALLKRQSKG